MIVELSLASTIGGSVEYSDGQPFLAFGVVAFPEDVTLEAPIVGSVEGGCFNISGLGEGTYTIVV